MLGNAARQPRSRARTQASLPPLAGRAKEGDVARRVRSDYCVFSVSAVYASLARVIAAEAPLPPRCLFRFACCRIGFDSEHLKLGLSTATQHV